MGAVFKILMYILFLVMYANNVTSEPNISAKSDVLLSRRKRFLVFPEGSSFQLVFCLTFPTVFAIGDIFLWGYTAALAYELPQDPYSPFRHRADPLHRRMDSKTIYFTDNYGKVLFNMPYKRKSILNPAFAKRSVSGGSSQLFENRAEKNDKTDKMRIRASKHKREFLKSEYVEQRGVEFHRSSRAALYRKMEAFFQALGGNGRHCVLKTLCLVGQTQDHPQGSFLQEILRATFTLPKGEFDDEYQKEYDKAHSATESCDVLYPDCDELLLEPTLPTFV